MKCVLVTELNPRSRASVARATRWLRPCLLGILLFSSAAAQAQPAAEAWVRRYDSGKFGSLDSASGIVADSGGNAIVAGDTFDAIAGEIDMLIIKYSGAGMA